MSTSTSSGLVVLTAVILLSARAGAAEAQAGLPDPSAHRFTAGAVPTLTFNTDEGFGTGGVVSLFHHHEGVKPFRDQLRINFFISTKLTQSHAITWEAIRPFGVLGRSFLRLGYFSTVAQNYCGLGNLVTCDPAVAATAAERAGLVDDPERSDDAFDDFKRRYYRMRFIRPHATVLFRPWLRDKPWRTELLIGWRGSSLVPGEISKRGPYPGSLYELDFPGGEAGISSVPFLGVIVDNRDDEIFPLQGLYAEASVRGGNAWTGSTWPHAGFNATGALFVSLLPKRHLVLATRGIADVIVGRPSTEELSRLGGTHDSIAFGGSAVGRGIRERRYLGAVKLLGQTELRSQPVDVRFLEQDLSFGTALFTDYGLVGGNVDNWQGEPLHVLTTAGISWRILWNHNFAVRFDLAVSPDETQGPGFYIIVGQVF